MTCWSLFRGHRTLSPALHKTFPALQFLRRSSFAALDNISATADGEVAPEPPHHPWPEWVSFVDRLKSKGYFAGTTQSATGEVGGGDAESLYNDMKLLKDPCLSFARDRYDILKSLSKKDIQAVVQNGCPNLMRKPVNSAKSLRAYVRLDEGDVCSACNLRGSCDKAYVVLKEPEITARTVDVVRILMSYALDPLVHEDKRPPGRDLVEASARKLLTELICLSETTPDQPLANAPSRSSKQRERTPSYTDDGLSQDVEMKRGDWMCPNCKFMNFAKNTRCRSCKEGGPKSVTSNDTEMKKGDWICKECDFMNFARNRRCLKCKAEGPKRVEGDVEMKKGDWNCPECGFMNFASKRACMRCTQPRPQRQLSPGEWECPSCDFLNYARNKECLKCKTSKRDPR